MLFDLSGVTIVSFLYGLRMRIHRGGVGWFAVILLPLVDLLFVVSMSTFWFETDIVKLDMV